MAFSPDAAASLVRKAWENGRLAHAFLISGQDGADLHRAAIRISSMVNGWKEPEDIDGLRNLGAIVVEPESKLRRITIDPIREVNRALQYTSSENRMKIVVLNQADRLTPEAANAFLKTLEEPPPDTLIMLLSRAPEQLLDTIRSRCVRLPLYRSSEGGLTLTGPQSRLTSVLAEWFSREKPSPARAMVLLYEFQKILGGIRGEIEDENKELLKEEVRMYGKTTDGGWLKDREKYYDDLTASSVKLERDSLIGLLFTWMGEILRRRHGLAALDLPDHAGVTELLASRFTDSDLHRRLRAVEELRRNLTTNVMENLALEVGFLKAFS